MIAYLKEMCAKLWQLGKIVIPVLSIWEFISYLSDTVFVALKVWFFDLLDQIKAEVMAQLAALSIDLAPPPAFLNIVAKINVVVPLEEMWHYALLYLAFASFVVGIKWFRNLFPGLK